MRCPVPTPRFWAAELDPMSYLSHHPIIPGPLKTRVSPGLAKLGALLK